MKNTNNKGITLIALVITIIVMLILVAITINLAINGGLFDYTKTAKGETISKIQEEQEISNIDSGGTYDNLINKYSGKKIITFYIKDIPYQAEEGMTWAEWVADETYNSVGFHVSGNRVYFPRGGFVTPESGGRVGVGLTTAIEENHYYGESDVK